MTFHKPLKEMMMFVIWTKLSHGGFSMIIIFGQKNKTVNLPYLTKETLVRRRMYYRETLKNSLLVGKHIYYLTQISVRGGHSALSMWL